MEEICKVCKTNFKTKEGIIHFCPNCGYKTISAKERNDYIKEINKKLDKDLKIELSTENKEANATSISKAFNYLYSDSLNLSLEDIYNLTSICFKEVDNKNKKGSEKGTPYRCSVENMMREKNIKNKAQLK